MNIAELEPEQVKPDLCNALYWSLMVVLLLMIIGQFMSFQEKPMPIYGGYELLESRYWKNFKSIGNKPVVYQTTANYFTSNNHLEVYLQHTKE